MQDASKQAPRSRRVHLEFSIAALTLLSQFSERRIEPRQQRYLRVARIVGSIDTPRPRPHTQREIAAGRTILWPKHGSNDGWQH